MGTKSSWQERMQSNCKYSNHRKQMGHKTMVLLGSRNANNCVRVQGHGHVHSHLMKKEARAHVVSDIRKP